MGTQHRGSRPASWVLPSKLVRPRLGAQVVERPRVWHLLDRAVPAPASVIAAPAGYGKTVAVTSWLEARSLPAAWLSIDRGDNDRVRLWAHVVASAGRQWPAVRELATPRRGSIQAAIQRLGAAIGETGRRGVLVLDDVHLLEDDACLDSLRDAVPTLGPSVHVMLITRDAERLDPTMAELARIDRASLAFTPAEARRMLLGVEGLKLSPGRVDALTSRSDGWAAALRLAAVWLADQDRPNEAVDRFSGNHRWLVEYLVAVVLDGLEPALGDFLIRTSALPRLSSELCDYTLERTDSAVMLSRLQTAGLFLNRVEENTWFAYHAMFGEALAARLDQQPEQQRQHLARRAGDWLERRGLIEEAIAQAVLSGDHRRVAAMLIAHHLELTREGRAASLSHWIAALPEPIIAEHPGLIGAELMAMTGMTDRQQRSRVLAHARVARRRSAEHWTPYEEAALSLLTSQDRDDDLNEALTHARRAAALSREHGIDLIVPALAAVSFLHFLRGEDDLARQHAHAARAEPRSAERPFGYATATATLAALAAEQRADTTARDLADEAMRSARHAEILDTWTGARVRTAAARTAINDGQLSWAEDAIQAALRDTPRDSTAGRAWMLATLAEIAQLTGQPQRARELLARAERLTPLGSPAGRPAALIRRLAILPTLAGDTSQ